MRGVDETTDKPGVARQELGVVGFSYNFIRPLRSGSNMSNGWEPGTKANAVYSRTPRVTWVERQSQQRRPSPKNRTVLSQCLVALLRKAAH